MSNISEFLSSPRLLHFVMPVLMVYLVIGTIAQKYIGLYEATKMFFSTPILWINFVPLPGMPIFMALIFINLICKLIFKSPWTKQNAGNIITHIGALLLLLGGLFTALFSSEGYMDLMIGQSKTDVRDYHTRELVLQNTTSSQRFQFRHNELKTGDILQVPKTDVKIEILEACQNCQIVPRTEKTDEYKEMAQHMQLTPGPLKKTDEENMAGLTLSIEGSENDGIYVVLEDVPKYPILKTEENELQISLEKQSRDLPFKVELINFRKELYPGTETAKSYQSKIRIHDGGAQWESVISMNEPLRYKGYTFFQSSYMETPSGPVSVLAVVWNAGRAFPYISGIVMCLGMIIHLMVRRSTMLPSAQRKKRHAV